MPEEQTEHSTTGINNPQIEESKVTRPAISDEQQAWSVFENLKQSNDKRNRDNAEIAQRYAGKQPRDANKLKQESRDWQSNVPTLFLKGIIDRIVPTLISSIDSVRYLTQSSLPDKIDGKDIPERDKKIEHFRETITKSVRQWPEWRNFCAQLCQELVLIGYCFGCWTDEDTPWPLFVRQDKGFIPEGAPQFAKYFQMFALEQPILLHELVDIISNEKTARDAGWKIEACTEAANHALPYDPANKDGHNTREYADAIREGNPGASYSTGAKSIIFGHLFAIESEEKGKKRITHMILDCTTKKLLFERKRRFESMNDVVAPFTIEPGNGKFYGSQGVGRTLVNLSIGVDLATNDAIDQMKMAGLKILKTDSKTAINTQIEVRAPFVIVKGDGTIQKEDMPANIEAFIALYGHLTKVAEVAAGAYIPNQISQVDEGGKRTAREATIDYTRELQSKSAWIARFAGQFALKFQTIQKRLCQKDSSDPDAKECQRILKENGPKLSEQEIKFAAESPVMEVVQDLTGIENQAKTQLANELAGNPMVDQKKLLEGKIIAQSSPEYAKEIMLKDAIDPTIEIESVRKQIEENAVIATGRSVPVSPRDNDEIELKVLIGELKEDGKKLSQVDPMEINPEDMDHINAAIIHGLAHVQNWLKKGADKSVVKPYEDFLEGADKLLTQLAKQIQTKSAEAHQIIAHQKAIQQSEAQMQQQAQAEQESQEKEIPMTEKLLIAWIGQFPNLNPAEKARLEEIGGLRDPDDQSAVSTLPMDQNAVAITQANQNTPVAPAQEAPNPVGVAQSQATVPPPSEETGEPPLATPPPIPESAIQ